VIITSNYNNLKKKGGKLSGVRDYYKGLMEFNDIFLV